MNKGISSALRWSNLHRTELQNNLNSLLKVRTKTFKIAMKNKWFEAEVKSSTQLRFYGTFQGILSRI